MDHHFYFHPNSHSTFSAHAHTAHRIPAYLHPIRWIVSMECVFCIRNALRIECVAIILPNSREKWKKHVKTQQCDNHAPRERERESAEDAAFISSIIIIIIIIFTISIQYFVFVFMLLALSCLHLLLVIFVYIVFAVCARAFSFEKQPCVFDEMLCVFAYSHLFVNLNNKHN